MPYCQNCGSHVTARYARVRSRTDTSGVEACPWCPDKTWAGHNQPRESRSRGAHRSNDQTDQPARTEPVRWQLDAD